MHFFAIWSFFALCASSLEPPFPLAVIEKIDELGSTPSLISTAQLLAGISAAELAAFEIAAANAKYTNTNDTQPNPIATTFPNATTGVINGSFVVLPIDYSKARAIIPSKYNILRKSIYTVLPEFPRDKYPLLLSTQVDHDIQTAGFLIPDFSSVQFRFPFIDLLVDGYSTFSYIPTIVLSNDALAIAGSEAYCEDAIPATFAPPIDPYAYIPGRRDESIYFNVYKYNSSKPAVLSTTYRPEVGHYGEIGDYPLSFYTNVTNQPTFGCANSTCQLTCDNMIRFFNTRITAGKFRPVGISGHVSLAPAERSGITLFPRGAEFRYAKGATMAMGFLENNNRDCANFKGYQDLGV